MVWVGPERLNLHERLNPDQVNAKAIWKLTEMMHLWFWKDAECAVLLSTATVLHLEMLLERRRGFMRRESETSQPHRMLRTAGLN